MQILKSVPRQASIGPGLFVVTILLILSLGTFFWKLGTKPLENWDEGIHAEVTREVLSNHAWITLSYRDALYTAKPPLKFWLTAPLFALTGPSEFNARFWSALAGLATTLLLGVWAFRWNTSVRFALLVGAIFLFGRFVMFHSFRTGETDGLLVFFMVAALYAYWQSRDDRRWFIAFGALTGLAVMTKSVGGLLPLIIVGLDITLSRNWSKIGRRTFWWSAAAAGIIALPWHAVELIQHGKTFIDGYIGFNIIDRSADVLYANNVSWWWYADIIVKRMIPFGSFIPLALFLTVRRMIRRIEPIDRLMILWIIVVFTIFSIVRTKFDWYILPLYPAVAFLLARGFSEFLHQSRDRVLLFAAAVSWALCIYRLPIEFVHSGWLWKLTPYAWLPGIISESTVGRVGVGVTSAAVVGFLMWILRRRIVISSTRAVGMVLVLYLCLLAAGWQWSYLRHLPSTSPMKTIAEKVETLKISTLDVVGIPLVTQPAGNFYLRRIPTLTVHEQPAGTILTGTTVLTTVSQAGSLTGRAILESGQFVLLEVPSTN